MPQHLLIHLSQGLTLQFKIRPTPLAELWVERMQARGSYPLDHPDRFYGFGSQLEERIRAEIMIEQCITTINQHTPIIKREFDWSQDCLNYLHNIFERYHGLLDQQTSKYWQQAPDQVKQALSELNLAVHRCETVLEGTKPSVYNAIAQPLRFPVADLQYTGQPQQLIQEIARQQRVLEVNIQ
jgi:hypothetical protein